MKRFLVYLVLSAITLGHADVPKLLTDRAFTAATLAEAVNHYVAIGETDAIKEMATCAAQDAEHTGWISNRGFSVGERIGWLCRILYEPKQGPSAMVPKSGVVIPGIYMPLRAPKFGVLNIPQKTMSAEQWPLFPLVLSGSTYLVLNQGYTPNGSSEDTKHYLEYCQNNGVFRASPIAVPSQEQALQDVAAFRQTAAWKAIKWQDDDGYTYPMGEQFTLSFLQTQAKFTPSQVAAKKPMPKAGATVATVQ